MGHNDERISRWAPVLALIFGGISAVHLMSGESGDDAPIEVVMLVVSVFVLVIYTMQDAPNDHRRKRKAEDEQQVRELINSINSGPKSEVSFPGSVVLNMPHPLKWETPIHDLAKGLMIGREESD